MSLFMKGDSNESYLWCVFLLLESFCHRYAKLNFQMHHICFFPYWKRLWDFLWLFHFQNVITIIRIKLKWILHGFGQKNAVFLFWFGNSYLGPNCLGSLQKPFTFRNFSVNVFKYAWNIVFAQIYWENPKWKISFFVQWM